MHVLEFNYLFLDILSDSNQFTAGLISGPCKIYAIRKDFVGNDHAETTWISNLIDSASGKILGEQLLSQTPKELRIQATYVVQNRNTNHFIMCLNDKSVII